MATDIFDSLTDHSPLDGTNDAINGSEVDANPNVLGKIMDGTTATDLATDSTVDFRFTSSRAGLRAITTDNAAGSVYYGFDIEWDPGDAGNMSDGSSGIGLRFLMPDDADTQTAYARMYCLMVDDAAASDDAEIVFETAVAGTLTTEVLRFGANGLVWNDDSADLDCRFEGNGDANLLYLDAGNDRVGIGTATPGAQFDVQGAAGAAGTIRISTAELTVVDGDILGRVDFIAPLESDGTDAILVGASIWAEADDTFSASLNDTDLVFAVAESETAAERMRLSYDGTDVGLTFSGNTAITGGNITIGTAVAGDGTLHVHTATAGSVTANANADDLVVEGSGASGIHILGSDAGGQNIYFGSPSDEDIVRLLGFYNAGSQYFGAYVSGTERMRITTSGDLVLDPTGAATPILYINDTANADMTVGLTINQGANDDGIIALKSSDIAHGMTSNFETDTYGFVRKFSATDGGNLIQGMSEVTTSAVLHGICTTDDATRSTAAIAPVHLRSALKTGTSFTSNAANQNIVVFTNQSTTRFIFDADGDSHQDVGTAWTNFDDEDDASICRSVAHVMTDLAERPKPEVGPGQLIRSEFDDWSRDHKETLIRTGLIPRLSQEEIDNGDRPLMNMTQLARVHNGAIWQLHTGQRELQQVCDYQQEEIESLKAELKLLKG